MYQKKRINALYCRVSTDGQQTGLESQIRALKDWCVRKRNLPVIREKRMDSILNAAYVRTFFQAQVEFL